jgi:hypothetical protein
MLACIGQTVAPSASEDRASSKIKLCDAAPAILAICIREPLFSMRLAQLVRPFRNSNEPVMGGRDVPVFDPEVPE